MWEKEKGRKGLREKGRERCGGRRKKFRGKRMVEREERREKRRRKTATKKAGQRFCDLLSMTSLFVT